MKATNSHATLIALNGLLLIISAVVLGFSLRIALSDYMPSFITNVRNSWQLRQIARQFPQGDMRLRLMAASTAILMNSKTYSYTTSQIPPPIKGQ